MPFTNLTAEAITEFYINGFKGTQNPKAVGCIILIIFLLILLGSSANIYIIARDKRLHTPMYFFICSLSVVDIIHSTSSSPTMILVLLADITAISYRSCITQMTVYHLSSVMGKFTISLMAYDRLVAISNPLRYHSILTKTRIVLITVTLLILGCALIAVFTGIADRLPYCRTSLSFVFCDYGSLVRVACVNPDEYFVASTVISFFILFGPFGFIFISYLMIIFTVLKIAPSEERKKTYSTCLNHLIVVASVFVPPFVSIILTRIGFVLSVTERNVLIIFSSLGPCLVNPFVYCFRTKEIRRKLFRIIKAVAPQE
ncbi:olfactory receptor 10G4-like [Amia ocellicauda]|uniref:olfactory receptor 10G4-like n=1 Tax=Amia ocellicauda TaxID=2972642 RepID=UPI0034638BF3